MDDVFELITRDVSITHPNLPVVFCADDLALTNFRHFEIGETLHERLVALAPRQIDVLKGPVELAVAGVCPWLIFTRQAWPHIDETFEGELFYTLVLQSKGFTFGCLRHTEGLPANEGSILRIDPMELHWLQPGSCAHQHWIGLQWEVPFSKVAKFEVALREAMSAWATPGWRPPVMGAAVVSTRRPNEPI